MAESIQSGFESGANYRGAAVVPGWLMPTLLGLAAGVAAALFVTVHWTVAVAGALIVLVLSAVEYEPFLLLMIFLVPVGWTLKSELPVREVAMASRFAMVAGFFFGRFWRGELDLRRLWRPWATRGSFLFAAAALGSMVLGADGLTRDSVHSLYRLVSYIAFYLFLLAWVDSKRRLKQVAVVLLSSVILVALYGMFQILDGGYTSLWLFLNPPGPGFTPWAGRIPSVLNYPNSLAGYLNLVLPFALACWLLPVGRVYKRAGGLALGLGALALLLTQSLGGIIAFACVGGLAGFWLFGGWKKQIAWLGGVAILGISFYAARALLNPSHSGLTMGHDLGTRLLLWTTAWHFFVSSPFWGIGWGNFVTAYGAYLHLSWMKGGVFEAHNIYLQLLSETGVVGFVSFFGLLFVALREARRQVMSAPGPFEKALAFGCFGAFITVLVHGLIDFLLEVSPPFGTIFWVLLALLVLNGQYSKVRASRLVLKKAGNPVGSGLNSCA